MTNSLSDGQSRRLGRRATEWTIRLVLVAGLTYWCFLLFRPFLMPLIWGMVIAVALHPLFCRLESLLGGRRKLAGTLFILVGLGALAVPAFLLSESLFEGLDWLRVQENRETMQFPPPPAGVADWPLIGDRLHGLWTLASEDPKAMLGRFGPEVMGFGSWLLSALTGFGKAFLLTIVAIVIAGVMLIHAEAGARTTRAIGARVGGAQGESAVTVATQAIRSVAAGVIGVAAVQATLAAAGLFVAGVPAAALWAGLVLILAVAQLPPLVILGPAIVYVMATSDSTLIKVLFTIWSLLVSFSDVFLKPMFLGRGTKIPMPVILIGAIGGVIRGGIIGLFVGAVVMAIGYMIFKVWMEQAENDPNPQDAAPHP
jgi:predicted PurR-regulated permease PerM